RGPTRLARLALGPPAGALRSGPVGDSGGCPAGRRRLLGRDRVRPALPLARGPGTHQRAPPLVPAPIALPLAPGTRQSLPPRQPDGDGGAGAGIRCLPPRDALPGAAQSPASVPAGRQRGAAQPDVLRYPAGPA